MKFNLSVCLLFLSLYGLSQALPVRPWSELRLQRSEDEIAYHVLDNEGMDVFSVHAEPRELGKHLLVELAGDHVQIDNRAAFENGAQKTNTDSGAWIWRRDARQGIPVYAGCGRHAGVKMVSTSKDVRKPKPLLQIHDDYT